MSQHYLARSAGTNSRSGAAQVGQNRLPGSFEYPSRRLRFGDRGCAPPEIQALSDVA
jgi:hypothetical protein